MSLRSWIEADTISIHSCRRYPSVDEDDIDQPDVYVQYMASNESAFIRNASDAHGKEVYEMELAIAEAGGEDLLHAEYKAHVKHGTCPLCLHFKSNTVLFTRIIRLV